MQKQHNNLLMVFFKENKIKISLSFVTSCLGAAAVLMGGQSLRALLDNFNKPVGHSHVFGMLIFVAFAIAFIAFIRTYTTSTLAKSFVSSIQQRITKKILKVKRSVADNFSSGHVISIWQNDLGSIESFIAQNAPVFIRSFLQLLGALGFCIYTSYELALSAFSVILAIAIPFYFLLKLLRASSKRYDSTYSVLYVYINSLLNNLMLVQSFGASQEIQNKFNETHNLCRDAFVFKSFSRSVFIAFVIGATIGGILLVLYFGRSRVIESGGSWSSIVVFSYYAVLIATSCHNMAENGSYFALTFSALQRVDEFLSLPEQNTGWILPTNRPDIEFRNVSFAYEENQPSALVLDDISFKIPYGSSLGVVGPSGSGKSTILRLIMGFYDSINGSVTIDGSDIKDIMLERWRQSFFWIPQDVALMPGTLRDHMLLGIQANDKSILDVFEKVGLDYLFANLPKGLDTLVGEGGHNFSGGERQRIAFAKAILSNRSVLLFDEPTSALDANSEYLMGQEAIKLIRGKTCVMVTHRLAGLQEFDNIIVIENGHLIQSGTHQELLKREGLYKDFSSINGGFILDKQQYGTNN